MRPEELTAGLEPVLSDMGIDRVDLYLHGRGGRTLLRILVDEPGGISIRRVSQASRAISDLLDQKDLIPTRYTLEVSSPGVDRPLKNSRDFIRHIGRLVSVQCQVGETTETLVGRIRKADEETVLLAMENGTQEKIVELGRIQSAVVLLEF